MLNPEATSPQDSLWGFVLILLGSKEIYVSATGLKPKGLIGWIRFWVLTIPAFKNAQKAEGVLLFEVSSQNHFQHTFTVWASKNKC
jgi:hypothetical protein